MLDYFRLRRLHFGYTIPPTRSSHQQPVILYPPYPHRYSLLYRHYPPSDFFFYFLKKFIPDWVYYIFEIYTYLQLRQVLGIADFWLKSCIRVQYTRIKLKYFLKSKNKGLIAENRPFVKKNFLKLLRPRGTPLNKSLREKLIPLLGQSDFYTSIKNKRLINASPDFSGQAD